MILISLVHAAVCLQKIYAVYYNQGCKFLISRNFVLYIFFFSGNFLVFLEILTKVTYIPVQKGTVERLVYTVHVNVRYDVTFILKVGLSLRMAPPLQLGNVYERTHF